MVAEYLKIRFGTRLTFKNLAFSKKLLRKEVETHENNTEKSPLASKVLIDLNGKPILLHVLENLKQAGIQKICIVLGKEPAKSQILSLLKEFTLSSNLEGIDFSFVEQKEPKGTAHALMQAAPILEEQNYQGSILVCCGDMPAIQPNNFRSLVDLHQKKKHKVTLMTTLLDEPKAYGRILRDKDTNQIRGIKEYKDATDQERKIKEINTGTYIFESPEIFTHLLDIGNTNAQNEYYLTDIIALYLNSSKKFNDNGIVGVHLLENSLEAQGINTLEDLEFLEQKFKEGILKLTVSSV